MQRTTLLTLSLCLLFSPAAFGQADGPSDRQDKIQNALSAAPDYIAREAAVWDWPAEGGGEPPVLREGTNNWTCFPDYPETPGNDPMCHDEAFLEWHLAALRQEEPNIDRVGLSYMLAGGGFVDDKGELVLGPHVMIALPDLADAEGIRHVEYADAPQHVDAPHIFHGGTPYEIIIVPVAAAGEKIQVVSR